MNTDRDAVEWLQMMAHHSHMADSTRATMARIARELEQVRAEVKLLRAAVPILARMA